MLIQKTIITELKFMDIKNELQGVFRDVFDDDSIELFNEMTAADIEDWDFLSHVQLIVAIEKHFKLKFSTGDIMNLKNVGEMIEMIEKKLTKN